MYTGNVSGKLAPEIRELQDVRIAKMSVGPFDNNSYLLTCKRTGEQLLIDAAHESDRLLDLIGSGGLSAVFTTHSHPDHWQALDTILEKTGALSFAPDADVSAISNGSHVGLQDDATINCGNISLKVLTVGGHTPGCSMIVYHDPAGSSHLFSGDALFPGGVGKTQSTTDFETLFRGVETKVFTHLLDDTWIYPGHGNDTTVGTERPALPSWQERGW